MDNKKVKHTETIWAVLSAAGLSSRMKEYKPLLPLEGSTIIENTIARFQQAGITNLIAVTGHNREILEPVLKKHHVVSVYNEIYDKSDMFHSIRLGVETILEQEIPAGIFITPADIPLIQPFTILRIQKTLKEHACQAVIPQYQGQNGHPPLLGREAVTKLLQYNGSQGLRGFLNSLDTVSFLPVSDSYMLLDADTPRDYQLLLEASRHFSIPDKETCQNIWEYAQTPLKTQKHCWTVAKISQKAGVKALKKVPVCLQEDFLASLLAGALLHDVLRQYPGHAKAGADFLKTLGYPRIAGIVQAHQDLLQDSLLSSLLIKEGEAENFWLITLPSLLVYMADRLTQGDMPCIYEKKYEAKRKQFEHLPPALEALEKDKTRFQTCRKSLKELMGYDLFE